MQPPFVKKFDFRAVYGKDIFDKDAYYLGLAIQKVVSLKKILIGWDHRVASKNLAHSFMKAFIGTDIEISFIEQCPIDYITVGAHAFDFDYSVMFTGSHNAWDWSGLLMHSKGGASVDGELVTQIVDAYNQVSSMPILDESVDLNKHTNFKSALEKVYESKYRELIDLSAIKPAKVLVDLGDGSGAMSLNLLEKLLPQITFERLNTREIYDAQTPHTADPSILKNMQQLMDAVRHGSYDAGFAFDSDADRVLAVDEHGSYLNGSMIGGAMIEMFAEHNHDMTKFGYAVECGPAISNTFADLKNDSISLMPIPVGRSLLRRMIQEGEVDLAVENVGHFYIKDFFMTDSGVFSLALILQWMSENGALSGLAANHPDGQRFQGHFAREGDYETKIDTLVEKINDGMSHRRSEKITTDGIRYNFYDDDKLVSWFALRPSGYEPIIKYYYGSLDESDFAHFKETFPTE